MASVGGNSYRSRINRILDYIAEFPDKDLSLAALSRMSGFSEFHFHRIFREYTGESPGGYQRRIRLEQAVFMLRYNPGKTITEIAFSVGFNSCAAFTRAFSGHFGISPRKLRSGGSLGNEVQNGLQRPPGIPPSLKTINVEMLKPLHVFTRKYTGTYFNFKVKDEWCRHIQNATARGYLTPLTRYIGIVYDDPDCTDDTRCRYECAVTAESASGNSVRTIPGGRYAVFTIEGGDSDNPMPLYRWIYGTWLPENGYEPRETWCYNDYFAFVPGRGTDLKCQATYRICLPIRKCASLSRLS